MEIASLFFGVLLTHRCGAARRSVHALAPFDGIDNPARGRCTHRSARPGQRTGKIVQFPSHNPHAVSVATRPGVV